jgi:hypothetical protein
MFGSIVRRVALLLVPLTLFPGLLKRTLAQEPAVAETSPEEEEAQQRVALARAAQAIEDQVNRAKRLRLEEKPDKALEGLQGTTPGLQQLYSRHHTMTVIAGSLRYELEKVKRASREERQAYVEMSEQFDAEIEALQRGNMKEVEKREYFVLRAER